MNVRSRFCNTCFSRSNETIRSLCCASFCSAAASAFWFCSKERGPPACLAGFRLVQTHFENLDFLFQRLGSFPRLRQLAWIHCGRLRGQGLFEFCLQELLSISSCRICT